MNQVTRAFLFVFALVVGAMLAGGLQTAAAAEVSVCSNTATDSGDCTPLQELIYCLGEAFSEYVDCVDDGGVINDIGCGWTLVAEVVECLYDLNHGVAK